MELTLDAAWAWLKATWKWIAGGGLLYLIGRPLADAAAEWWRDRIARGAELRRKRADVVDGIQERLVGWMGELQAASGIHSLSDPHGLAPLQRAVEAEKEARQYIESRRHYLPDGTVEKIDGFCIEARRAWAGISTGVETRDLAGERAASEASRLTMKGYDIVHKKLPPLMDELREEFRRLVEGRRRRKKPATRQNRRIKS